MSKRNTPATTHPVPSRPEPSEAERALIDAAHEWRQKRKDEKPPAPVVAIEQADEGVRVHAPYEDDRGWSSRLCQALGTNSGDFMSMAMSQLGNATGAKPEGYQNAANRGLAFVAGIGPQDELQTALAVQMYATHCAAMEMARRMQSTDTVEKMAAYGSLATKLQRTFTAQIEAMAKLRSGGKQQVEVRYVYIDARNSQNVIGSPIQPGGGGAAQPRLGQPHEPFIFAGAASPFGLSLPGQEPCREPLPSARDEGAETMSATWGQEPRRASRGRERALPNGAALPGSPRAAGRGARSHKAVARTD